MKTLMVWFNELIAVLNFSRWRAAREHQHQMHELSVAAEFWTAEAEREYVKACEAYAVYDFEAAAKARARYDTAIVRLRRDVMEPIAKELGITESGR